MADVRRARREAEKAAREALSGTLVDKAGELGVALAGQNEASENVTEARSKARALVEAAQAEGEALVAAAEAEAGKADEVYAAAWNAGKDAGWSPAQLRAMGYAKPPVARRSAPVRPAVADQAGSAASSQSDGDNEHRDGEHVADVA